MRKKIFQEIKNMTLMTMLTSPAYLAFVFWSTVNLSFLALSISLLFFPTDVAKLLVAFEGITLTTNITELLRFFGVYMLYATAGFNSMLSDAVTFTNLSYKRFIFTLTILYYIAGGVTTLYLVTTVNLFSSTVVSVTKPLVQVLVSLFLGALLLALLGTFTAVFSGFTTLVPNLMMSKTVTETPPKSRQAMIAVLEGV